MYETYKKWELDGYIKILSDYLVEKRLDRVDNSIKQQALQRLSNINYDNLFVNKSS